MKKDNIPGLEGYYISRLGTLWSRYHKSGKLTHSEWHKVKPNHNQKGYLFVQKKGKCWYLHRLVALAWIPNPNNYPIVCHKDNVVTHNWYKNLYWGTQKDNMQQCIRDGRTLKGNKNPMYGIYIGEVLLIQMLNYLKLKEEKLDLDMNLGKRFVD
jgi:hypothetical protein